MMRVWPFLVNELEPQYLLHDWRKVYECLAMFGIPVPRYGCVHREVPCWHLDYFVEEVDFVEVMGTAFGNLVEKPTVDGWEDQSLICFYVADTPLYLHEVVIRFAYILPLQTLLVGFHWVCCCS